MPVTFSCSHCRTILRAQVDPETPIAGVMMAMRNVHRESSPECPLVDVKIPTKITINR